MTGVGAVRLSIRLYRLFFQLVRVVETGRLVPSSISFALTVVCLAGASQAFNLKILLQASPLLLATMASFMMNDLWDLQKDVQAGKRRPLCRGDVGRTSVVVGLLATITLAIWIARVACPVQAFLVLAATIGFALLYSPFATTVPLAKNLFAAVLSCSPLVYANSVTGRPLFSLSLAAIALFIAGRELLLDVMDLEGDAAAGQKTIAFYLPRGTAVRAAWVSMFLSLAVMVLLPAGFISRLLQIVAGLSLLWAVKPGLDAPLSCRRLRATMLLGSFGVGLR